MLLALLHALACHAALATGNQFPLEATQPFGLGASDLDNSTAPFIFNGLSSFLTQWPNTVHGTGHSIVPGVLHPFTLLYHAREDPLLPPSPEWLAWDPEMSYAIMVPRGGQTHLATYRTTRSATVLYFDGMAAAWGEGWLDSQHMFIYGMSKNGSKDISWWDDYGRAEKLCEWAKTRDVEGFVRMNAGFEIVWCDFKSPALQLVSHLNITPPGTPERTSSPRFPHRDLLSLNPYEAESAIEDEFLEDPPKRPNRGPGGPGGGDRPGPGRGGGGGGPGRWFPRMSALAVTGTLEWIRAASHRSFSPQPHLTLSPAGMVTYYNPRLSSLAADRAGQPMRAHRLTNISATDAQSLVAEVESVLARGPAGSGFDWGTAARDVVEYWGDRIAHMEAYLRNTSDPRANATAALPAIRTLAYTLLNPYMQPGLTPNASGYELFFGAPGADALAFGANTTALERCTYQATGFLSQFDAQMTPQETLLQTTIETVLARLCTDFGVIFAQSSNLVELASGVDPRPFVGQWAQRVEDLMQWLDWATWLRCEDVCPRDYVCSTPLWPIAWFRRWGESPTDDDDFLKPRCMRMAV